ncbi:hypothetical protein ACQR1H_03050 [Bradyrhizobium sp. HKCCYLRH2015]|uniref:hypothetical protein n=1 Tax=Bradyrhizobium sp. HKCCYLRH2015 TaxID=3420742 RepID=UPI003EBF7E19
MNAIITLETILEPAAVPVITAETLFGTGQVETVLGAIETQARADVIDISTGAGRDAVKSLAYKIARSKTILDDMGKEHVAEIKKQAASIDAERRTIRDRLDALKDEVRKPVTDWEAAEQARISGHENTLVAIITGSAPTPGAGSAAVRARLDAVRCLATRDWEEFSERATTAVADATAKLSDELAAAEQRERDAAELEALRREKAEREAHDIAEKAQREAQERAERECQAAAELERQRAEQAEQWKREAEERARIAAEQAAARAVEQERLRVAEEKARAELAERRRAENKRRREKVHAAVKETLAVIVGEHSEAAGPAATQAAEAIVDAIAAGTIPHVSINY